jgi:NADH-quinone oxidoreductase subunit E
MWIFPGSDELLPGKKTLDQMSKDFAAFMPKEFTGSVDLMINPAAGVAAFSALGFGMASQALGVWMGAAAGAVEVSRRLYMPFLDEPTAEDFRDKTRTPVTRAREAAETLIADVRALAHGAGDAAAMPADAPSAAAVPEIAKDIVAPSVPLSGPEIAAELMPEDFRRPAAAEKPGTPDDLKLISGIGPKLEKVLNGLGVWTFGQIAAWSREEIAWMDDYLSFKGRIDRDGWIEQARSMAAAKAAGEK